MQANLCTNGNRGESVNRLDVYLMIHTRAEQGDKVWVGSVESLAMRDIGKKVLSYELILWAPNFPSLFVEDGVKVRVSRRRVSAQRDSKKVWVKVEVIEDFVDGGRQLYGGGGDG